MIQGCKRLYVNHYILHGNNNIYQVFSKRCVYINTKITKTKSGEQNAVHKIIKKAHVLQFLTTQNFFKVKRSS